MTFTIKSGLVKIWGRRVLSGQSTLDDVPDLANLKDMVREYVEQQNR